MWCGVVVVVCCVVLAGPMQLGSWMELDQTLEGWAQDAAKDVAFFSKPWSMFGSIALTGRMLSTLRPGRALHPDVSSSSIKSTVYITHTYDITIYMHAR
jgi:hypothetical protein